MKQVWAYIRGHARMLWLVLAGLGLLSLLLYRLGNLTAGLSAAEYRAANLPLGWHGIYHDPAYLPLKVVRSVLFFFFPDHGPALSRLPNVLFGFLSIVSFIWLIRIWHGKRLALITGLLFASSAWTLHVSRLV